VAFAGFWWLCNYILQLASSVVLQLKLSIEYWSMTSKGKQNNGLITY